MTQRVPTRLGAIVPDRIEKFERPSSRWVIEHQPAYAPHIVGLTINPTVANREYIEQHLKGIMIGIERVDHTHSALLFGVAVAGEVAYSDKINPYKVDFCYLVVTAGGKRQEFYKPDSLIGVETVITHYEHDGAFVPFDYRRLVRWHQTEEKCSIEFSEEAPSMRIVLRDRAKYKP